MTSQNDLALLLSEIEKLKQRLDGAAKTIKEDRNTIYELKDIVKDLKSQIVASTEPTQSKEQDKLFAALIKAKKEMLDNFQPTATKVRGSGSRGDLGDLLQAMLKVGEDGKDAMDRNGIDIIQEPIECASKDLLKTTIIHVSGQWRSSTRRLIVENDNKSINQSYETGKTYARKGALDCIFNIYLNDKAA